MSASRVAAVAALVFSLPVWASAPLIVSPQASSDLSLEFVLRTPKSATLDEVQLTVSGEEFARKPLDLTSVDVFPLILIDLGPPEAIRTTVSPALQRWIDQLAAAGAKAKPQWMFQFIAGDQNLCRLSKPFPSSAVATQLQALASSGAAPLGREDLAEMRDLFSGKKNSHTLVVLSEAAPVWLARETTEWLTRNRKFHDPADRRVLGRDTQWRLRTGESSAIRDVGDWITAGHLIPIMVSGADTMALPPEWKSLRHGTEEVLARFHAFRAPGELLRSGLLGPLTEHRGRVRVPLMQLQRPASGIYEVQLTAQDSKGNTYRSRDVSVADHALYTWRPWLMGAYIGVLFVMFFSLMSALRWYHGRGDPTELNAKFSDLMFKTISAVGAITLAICTGLISNTDALSLVVSGFALVVGILALILGGMFLRANIEQALAAGAL